MGIKNYNNLKAVDGNDHGFRHLQTQTAEPSITLHNDFVKRVYHQHKKHAKKIIILHSIARLEFWNRGFFHIDEFIRSMEGYGYSPTRELKRRTLQQLRSAPTFFKETKTGYFTFRSQKKLIGFNHRKNECLIIPVEKFHRENHKSLTDILVTIFKAGQVATGQTIASGMGMSRARFYAGKKTSRLMGFMDRPVMIELETSYETIEDATRERKRLYFKNKNKKRIISTVIKVGNQYKVCVNVAISNCLIQDRLSDGITDSIRIKRSTKNRPSTYRKQLIRTTTTFQTVYNQIKTALNPVTNQNIQYHPAKWLNDFSAMMWFERRSTV